MGQKVDPRGFRLVLNRPHDSNWYADKKSFAKYLHEDLRIRKYLDEKLKNSDVGRILITRISADKIDVTIFTYKVGLVLGRKGAEADKIRAELEKISGRKIDFKVVEIDSKEFSANVIARSIAQSIEKRVAFKKAMNFALNKAKKSGVLGIKITISGRLNGAEIARSESTLYGKVPLHSLKYDIDYATASAHTTYGVIGIKVHVSRGIKKEVVNNVNA
jgi:small subunit ribosomal protein S3